MLLEQTVNFPTGGAHHTSPVGCGSKLTAGVTQVLVFVSVYQSAILGTFSGATARLLLGGGRGRSVLTAVQHEDAVQAGAKLLAARARASGMLLGNPNAHGSPWISRTEPTKTRRPGSWRPLFREIEIPETPVQFHGQKRIGTLVW